jgi:hypothetical protein
MRRQQHIGRGLARLKAALVALLAALLLAGCGSSLPPLDAPSSVAALPAATPAPAAGNDLAFVVISAGQQLSGGRGPRRTAIASQWALATAEPPDASSIILTADDEAHPYIARVRAGRYELRSFAFGVGGQLYSSSNGLRGLSLAEFSVEPNEVLYVGHLLVKTENGLLGTLRNDFRLAIESHEAAARSYVARSNPALAARMQTRLITLAPMLQRLSQAAE